MSATIKRAAVPFRWSIADGFGANGKLLARSYGSELEGVFSRTSVKWVPDRNGLLVPVNRDIPALAWVRGVPVLLLEGEAENLVLRSSELDNAAWTASRASVSPNADVAPDGSLTADRLIEDGTAAASHRAYSAATFTITANANVCIGRFFKAGTRSWVLLGLTDSSETNGARVYFNVSTGAVGASFVSGTGSVISSGVEAFGNGWYFCWVVGNLAGGITAARHYFGLATGDGLATYSGDGASYVSTWGGSAINNAAAPSSYVPTTGTAATRSADALYFPCRVRPQALTLYFRGIELGTHLVTNGRWFSITNAASGNARLLGLAGGGPPARCGAYYENSTANVTSRPAATLALGDVHEFRAVLNTDGSVLGGVALNGGAETVAATSAAPSGGLAATWADERLYLGSPAAASQSLFGFTQIVVALGTRTLAELRALAEVG